MRELKKKAEQQSMDSKQSAQRVSSYLLFCLACCTYQEVYNCFGPHVN